jgi:carboxymethylenebutenolidase
MKRLLPAILLASSLVGNAQAQDYVLKRLDESPRHHEWVEIKHGDRTVHAFVVFPEKSEKVPAILVIHENPDSTTGSVVWQTR